MYHVPYLIIDHLFENVCNYVLFRLKIKHSTAVAHLKQERNAEQDNLLAKVS